MNKILKTLAVLAFLSLLLSCNKKACDNASACMVNNTQDTVYYTWNGNFYDTPLAPGEKACDYMGEMKWNESYTTFFGSDHGTYALDVVECENTYYLD